MLNFCTLFDSGYLHYGLCLHSSLMRHCKSFHLYVFAFDDVALNVLNKMALPCVTVISLSEFEDDHLLEVKDSRTKGEYCWTCTSSTIRYVLSQFGVESCTYVDSDIFFFSDPSHLIDEMKEKSVSIIEHRYHPDYDQTEASGKYCVQFMTFKNNESGMMVLNWWRDACIEWCFNRREGGRFGDQKYLDDWPERFPGVIHEIKDEGAGLAPWNLKSYEIQKTDECLWVNKSGGSWKLVFYHYHGFQILNSFFSRLTAKEYFISRLAVHCIYGAYLRQMNISIKALRFFDFAGITPKNLDISIGKKMRILLGWPQKNICRRYFL